MALKIAVFAPIPSPRVRIAMAVKPLFFRRVRTENYRSLINRSIASPCSGAHDNDLSTIYKRDATRRPDADLASASP